MVSQYLPLSQQNLILTGYYEPNKPRLAMQVAERLGMPFVDVERLIEDRLGQGVSEIRNSFGERRLQTVELDILQEAVLHRHTVIRVSGSILVQGDYVQRFQQTGPVICLVAQLGAILQRMHLSMGARFHDPADRGHMLGELKQDWKIRKAVGIFEVDTTYLNEEQMVDAVVDLWQEVAIERV